MDFLVIYFLGRYLNTVVPRHTSLIRSVTVLVFQSNLDTCGAHVRVVWSGLVCDYSYLKSCSHPKAEYRSLGESYLKNTRMSRYHLLIKSPGLSRIFIYIFTVSLLFLHGSGLTRSRRKNDSKTVFIYHVFLFSSCLRFTRFYFTLERIHRVKTELGVQHKFI